VSVANALNFIRLARSDVAVRAALERAGTAASSCAICAIGADLDLAFCEAEFDSALKIDWAARWAHFSNATRPDAAGSKGKIT
jgi:hypothetical protein